MRTPRVLVQTVIAAFLVGQGASLADTEQFRVETLKLPGRVVGVHAEDLNGDGKRDLVVVFVTGRPPALQRGIALFMDRGNGFGAQPDQVLSPPPGAAFLDVGEVEVASRDTSSPSAQGTSPGGKRRALVFGDQHGIFGWQLEPDGRRFDPTVRPLVKVSGLLAVPMEGDLPIFDLLRDWDGDGKPELLVPLVDGVAVFTRGAGPEGGWSRAGTLHIVPRADYAVRAEEYEPRLRNFAVRATFSLPELVTGDYDGDGKLDLFALSDDLLEVHKGGAGPTVFSPSATARHYLGVRSENEVRVGAHVHTTVRDLDGDGIADLAVNKITGGLGQMRAQTGFYFGRKGGGYDPPAQLLSREGYSGALAFGDLDGDGKLDLVMPHVDVGLAEMARVVLQKRMTIGWEARRNLGRSFSPQAEVVKEIDFPVDYSQLADIEGPYPSVDGDFDGDGKRDFVAGHGADALAVWLGGGKGLLADSPKAIVHVPPSRHYFVTDLDGDKRSDLVIFHRGRSPLATVIHVVRNTGHGW